MTTALAPIAAIDRVPLLLMLFPFLLYLNISHTEWKVIRLCTNDFQAILTRAIANPLTAQCHSRTGSMARRGGVSAVLEFQHRIDAGVVSRQRAGYCLGLVVALRSSTVSMGFGSIRRRCTSKAKHSSAISRGRERDRPVCFSIRCKRWRTVLGWQ